MKFTFLLMCCVAILNATAQKRGTYPSADSVMISGLVKKEIAVFLKDPSVMPDTSFTSLKILNHHGELKTTYQQIKAVLLKKILAGNLPETPKPKEPNSFYFVCKAMDGYTAVYSYNELFNAANNVFIVTAYDHFDLNTMPEKPVTLSLARQGSGRLGMRGLKSIDVRKAE
jgi:hypothetical protein